MISLWMLHAAAAASLLGVAGLALERAMLALGRPARWVWAGALALSLLLALAAGRLSWGPGAAGGVRIDLSAVEVLAAAPASGAADGARMALERALAAGWLLASCVLLAALLLSLLWLERRQRRWRHGIVAGRAVLVAPRTGPAVVGVLWPEIVVPRWVLEWDAGAQRLLLAHEREHLRAGDSHLLLAALGALVLMPWNPALWWQVRRLRLAVEVDCDARVLRQIPTPREYGLLLLEVGRRSSRAVLPSAAFSESRSLLERRIRVLAAPPRLAPRATAGLACAALGAFALACELPDPARPDLGLLLASATGEPGAPPATAAFTRGPELLTAPAEVARRVESLYPPMLRAAGIGGSVVVSALVDEEGAVADARAGGGRAELAEAAQRAVRTLRFAPATRGERRVPVWIELPVTFHPAGPAAPVERFLASPDAGSGAVSLPLWTAPRGAAPPSDAPTPVDVRPELRNRAEFGELLERLYPPLLREAGVGGTVLLWVHIDARGEVRATGVARTSGRAELDEAARAAMREARFAPARLAGRPVDAWIQVPVTLAVPGADQPFAGRSRSR